VGLLMRGIEMSEISLHVHIVPDPTISVHTCANRLRAQAVWHRQRCASLLELALLAAVLVNRIKHSPLPWWLPVCREVAEIPAPAQLAHMRSWRTRLRCHSPSKARLPCLSSPAGKCGSNQLPRHPTGCVGIYRLSRSLAAKNLQSGQQRSPQLSAVPSTCAARTSTTHPTNHVAMLSAQLLHHRRRLVHSAGTRRTACHLPSPSPSSSSPSPSSSALSWNAQQHHHPHSASDSINRRPVSAPPGRRR
jgi:hypothetical protein